MKYHYVLIILAGLAKWAIALPSRHVGPRQAPEGVLPPTQDPWYTAPTDYASATPGTVLRLRTAPGNITSIVGNSSVAYNILYRTTDSRYRPTWAVTTLFVPLNASSNSNNTLLSYQIPYDSANLDSSPSYDLYNYQGGYPDIGIALGQGWYVNVPDFEGPQASFTAGVVAGHATIDSIRAVLSPRFGLVNGTKYAMWGYSGGAMASEFAAELQVQYAPELNFSGVALGGLTPNLTNVLLSISGTAEAGLGPAGFVGLATQYPELLQLLQQNLNTNGLYNATTFLMSANNTLSRQIATFFGQDILSYFQNGAAILQDPVVRTVINRDGIMGNHGVPQTPLFIYKAIKDELSPVNDTDALVQRYCSVGARIRYDRNTVGTHTEEFVNGNARAFEFIASVLRGTGVEAGCSIRNVTVNATAGAE